jgi:hypothetical protein
MLIIFTYPFFSALEKIFQALSFWAQKALAKNKGIAKKRLRMQSATVMPIMLNPRA